MKSLEFSFQSKVWVYPGMAAWRFITIPKDLGKKIKEEYGSRAKGWGSLPVSATIGKTTWNTSIFPDKSSGSYLLPLKAQVRKSEGIKDDAHVHISLCMR